MSRIWALIMIVGLQSCGGFFGQNVSSSTSGSGPLASFSINQISNKKIILDATASSSFLDAVNGKRAGYLEYRWTFQNLDGNDVTPSIGFAPKGDISDKNLSLSNGGALLIKGQQEFISVQYHAPSGGVQNITIGACLEVRDANLQLNTSPIVGQICQDITLDSSASQNVISESVSIGGSVSGLTGSLVLQNNGGNDLTIITNGAFTFSTPINNGGSYNVTISTQPTGQTCSVLNGAGTASTEITTVTITCSDILHTIGGNVSGLVGILVLQNNAGDDEIIISNGAYVFNTPINQGATYNVTILTQPTGQICSLINDNGTILNDVTNIDVSCVASTHTVGGNVSGLTGTVVLENNGGDTHAITTNGVYEFSISLDYGDSYSVSVLTQPSGQICTVSNASGTVVTDVTNVNVTCSDTHTLNGTFTGIPNGSFVTLIDNESGQTLLVNGVPGSTGGFTFATEFQTTEPFDITVQSQSPTLVCTMVNKTGTFTGGNVSNIELNCAAKICSSVEAKYIKHCSPTAADAFGSINMVSVSANFAAVGTNLDDAATDADPSDNTLADSGGVFVYQRDELSGYWYAVDFVKSSNIEAGDWFGYAVKIDGYNKRLIVGARQEDSNSAGSPADNSLSAAGAAYIFERDATGEWFQTSYLKHPNPTATDNCGTSVAIDGDFAVMGCPDEDSNSDTNPANNSASASGCAIVFHRDGGGTWSQFDFLKASNQSNSDQFGGDVGIAGDYIIVGAIGEDSNTDVLPGNASSSNSGAAYIFKYDGVSNWAQEDFLKASNLDASDSFGQSVDVTAEGYAIVGARNEDSASQSTPLDNTVSASGAAYIYERDGLNWTEAAYMKHPNPTASDLFGYAVGISGNHAVVGVQSEDSDGPYAFNELGSASGAAFIYERGVGGIWNQVQFLKAFNQAASDLFGTGVGIDEDQTIIGATGEDSLGTSPFNESASGSGAAYIYELVSGSWSGD